MPNWSYFLQHQKCHNPRQIQDIIHLPFCNIKWPDELVKTAVKTSPQAHLSGHCSKQSRKTTKLVVLYSSEAGGCSDYPKWGPALPSLALVVHHGGTSFTPITKKKKGDIVCGQAVQESVCSFRGCRRNAKGFCGRRMWACIHLSLSQCCSLSQWVQHHVSFPSPSGALFNSLLPPSRCLSETSSQWSPLHQKESIL